MLHPLTPQLTDQLWLECLIDEVDLELNNNTKKINNKTIYTVNSNNVAFHVYLAIVLVQSCGTRDCVNQT